MSSFWSTSQGEVIEAEKEFDAGGGNFDPIPAGTNTISIIDEAKYDTTGGQEPKEFISLRWSVLEPKEYKNRKVFQKLWVDDLDPNTYDPDGRKNTKEDKQKAMNKRDKARRMLAAIDANCGGKLIAKESKPTTADLVKNLTNKPMQVLMAEWNTTNMSTGEPMSGNWVNRVAPRDADNPIGVPANAPKATIPTRPMNRPAAGGGGFSRDMDDDIPFEHNWR